MKYGKGLTRIISIKVVSLAYELMFKVYAQLGSLAALGLLRYPEVFSLSVVVTSLKLQSLRTSSLHSL